MVQSSWAHSIQFRRFIVATACSSVNASICANSSSSVKWRMATACCGQLALQMPHPLHDAAIVSDFFPCAGLNHADGAERAEGFAEAAPDTPALIDTGNRGQDSDRPPCHDRSGARHGGAGLGDTLVDELRAVSCAGTKDAVRGKIDGPELHMGFEKKAVLPFSGTLSIFASSALS